MPDTKTCTKCGESKPLDHFGRNARFRDGLDRYCRDCDREKSRRYRKENPERDRERKRHQREENRTAVFEHYGQACACCGSTERLTLDHVNGYGGDHRNELFGRRQGAGGPFYQWLVVNGFPEGFQTLCFLCNISKRNGPRCRIDHAAAVTA